MMFDLRWGGLALGALAGWLAAYPLALLSLWFAGGAAHQPLFGSWFADDWLQILQRLIPLNFLSAALGAIAGQAVLKAVLARLALRESEERFRNMANSAPDAIIAIDGKGAVSYWNTSAEKMFGYSNQEALGMELHSVIVPDRYKKTFEKGYTSFLKTGRGFAVGKTLELAALKKDGSEFPIELSLSAFHFHGHWHAVGIVRDVTDRKIAEKERLSKEKLKGVLEMAGAACHRLNQPLQTILWHTQVLLEDIPEKSAIHAELLAILDQINKMKSIIEKIMNITRYEAIDYYKDIKIVDIEKASEKAQ